ncbi:hypothetical protein EVAR_58254_1 [Eumeta japonica]|uniref:Uncharacterized protein n=1 Tax=Eumeta variegata TaxID=151549 RepID=A0A4C2A4S3_EUMVA|nr:hypothetical protein EVAR_58254_1 [Eumeta japonica]
MRRMDTPLRGHPTNEQQRSKEKKSDHDTFDLLKNVEKMVTGPDRNRGHYCPVAKLESTSNETDWQNHPI